MVKCFCDKCKKEVPRVTRVLEYSPATDALGIKLMDVVTAAHDLCGKCNERFKRLDLDIADYMKLSEEEIDLLEYTFKVGDEVITSTGEVGIIEDICTCERCKVRGFYEPRVKTQYGHDIYITDTDKNNGFSNFYKIGRHKFGNLDEEWVAECIENTRKQILDGQKDLTRLMLQLDRLRKIKQANGGDNT